MGLIGLSKAIPSSRPSVSVSSSLGIESNVECRLCSSGLGPELRCERFLVCTEIGGKASAAVPRVGESISNGEVGEEWVCDVVGSSTGWKTVKLEA